MAHHVRIRLDPKWAIGTTWTSGELSSLDAAMVASVNGDGGGTYAPSATVLIQGAGVRLVATTHTLSGAHSDVVTSISGSELLTHGDSDYAVLGAGHTGSALSTTSPITCATWSTGWSSFPPALFGPPCILSTMTGATARTRLRVHNGATLASVTITFVVANTTPTPAVLPRLGVFAKDAFGNKFPLSIATPYQALSASATWPGVSQTITFTCDSAISNPYVVIDTTQFSYFAEVVEISGAAALAGRVFYSDLVSSFTNITDIRPR